MKRLIALGAAAVMLASTAAWADDDAGKKAPPPDRHGRGPHHGMMGRPHKPGYWPGFWGQRYFQHGPQADRKDRPGPAFHGRPGGGPAPAEHGPMMGGRGKPQAKPAGPKPGYRPGFKVQRYFQHGPQADRKDRPGPAFHGRPGGGPGPAGHGPMMGGRGKPQAKPAGPKPGYRPG
ncbi:MAG: hypothetical protein J7M21_06780, partial [Planctomycetes bacterium]|nr:hypothetical protein [Planctomycetota bacterium]